MISATRAPRARFAQSCVSVHNAQARKMSQVRQRGSKRGPGIGRIAGVDQALGIGCNPYAALTAPFRFVCSQADRVSQGPGRSAKLWRNKRRFGSVLKGGARANRFARAPDPSAPPQSYFGFRVRTSRIARSLTASMPPFVQTHPMIGSVSFH